MTHASLFSGIGGFDLAAEWMGWENVFHCEFDQKLREFLKIKWPDAYSYGDINHADFTFYRNRIDILTGGFPCQNISSAGKGEGIHGAKSRLWFQYHRAIREIHPRFILIENSNRITNKGLEIILLQLAQIGYNAEWETFYASEFGHDHRRARTYILAYTATQRWKGILQSLKKSRIEKSERQKLPALDSYRHPFLRFTESCGQPVLFGVDDGIPNRMDLVPRLGAIGNAIVPQIAFEIFKAIEHASRQF